MEKILEINQKVVEDHLGELVRTSVEETLNNLLDAEADRLCNATRYEHTEERADTRAGHYQRDLQTRVGEVTLKVPKLRRLPFETAIIERYRRRETSIEEALMEMYLAGVSVRRVEDITEALWGSRVSAGKVSELNQRAYENIEKWRNRQLTGEYAYVYLDGIWLKKSWGGEVSNVAVLAAIAVNQEGFREVIGCAEGSKEDTQSWLNFLRHLKERGLKGTQLFISDKCLGLLEALGETFPEAKWQRCMVHFYRNVFSVTPRGKLKEVAAMLKAIHAQEDKAAARAKAAEVVSKLKSMKLAKASETVAGGIEETLTYMNYPREHWVRIRTNNALERLFKEVRRRTRVIGSFPDGHAALMLTAARLRHMAYSKWGEKRYLNMLLLRTRIAEEAEKVAA
jgi:transposase-like protein